MKHVPSAPRRDGWRPAGISISTRGGVVGRVKILWKWRPEHVADAKPDGDAA